MDDVIQHQRLASGFVPGVTDAGAALTDAVLQNCTCIRTPAAPVGSYDIIIGGNGPSPVGIGGKFNVAAAGIVVDQGRVNVTVRGPTAVHLETIVYGDELAGPLRNPQLIRLTFLGAAGLADVQFDFSIDRVLSPAQEP